MEKVQDAIIPQALQFNEVDHVVFHSLGQGDDEVGSWKPSTIAIDSYRVRREGWNKNRGGMSLADELLRVHRENGLLRAEAIFYKSTYPASFMLQQLGTQSEELRSNIAWFLHPKNDICEHINEVIALLGRLRVYLYDLRLMADEAGNMADEAIDTFFTTLGLDTTERHRSSLQSLKKGLEVAKL